MKIFLKTSAILSLLILLGFAGCMGFRNHIYNRTDCVQFNIDNIELRTGINIPAVSDDVICNYQESASTKTSVFTLDRASLDLAYYVNRNNFVEKGDFYVNVGERDDTKWDARLHKEKLELTVELVYK